MSANPIVGTRRCRGSDAASRGLDQNFCGNATTFARGQEHCIERGLSREGIGNTANRLRLAGKDVSKVGDLVGVGVAPAPTMIFMNERVMPSLAFAMLEQV